MYSVQFVMCLYNNNYCVSHDGSSHDGSSHDGSSHDGSSHDGSSHDGSSHDGSSHDDSAVVSAEARSSLYRGHTLWPMCLQICHSRHMQYIQCTNLFRRGLLRDLGINEVVEVTGEALEGQV